MSSYNRVCSSCPQNHRCLLQDDGSVEECEEVIEAERESRARDDEDDFDE